MYAPFDTFREYKVSCLAPTAVFGVQVMQLLLQVHAGLAVPQRLGTLVRNPQPELDICSVSLRELQSLRL